MKKAIAFLIFVAIIAIPRVSLGQRNNFSLLAVDLGINSTMILNQNMYGNPEIAYDQKFGFSGMVSYRKFIDKYGYSLGLGAINAGQKYSGEMAGTDAQRIVNFNYLQIPVLGMYSLGGNRRQTWLMLGPQFMILLSAQQDFNRKGGGVLPNPDLLYQGSSNVINRFNPIDVMLAFELNQSFSAGKTKIASHNSAGNKLWSLSLKGALGLTDINRREYHISNTHNVYAGSHNFYLGLHIGFFFNKQAKQNHYHKVARASYGSLYIPGTR